jgi:hypothetical protein
MSKTVSIVDFVIDDKFVDSLIDPGDSDIMKGETFYFFYPLYHIYLLYGIIAQLIDKNECPHIEQLKKLIPSSAAFHLMINFKKEIPVYRVIYDIMLNNLSVVKAAVDHGIIDREHEIDSASLFRYARSNNVYGFNLLSIAAVLGRHEIFNYFLEKEVNVNKMVYIDTVKPAPIPLTVNECLLMNAIYKWYKGGKKKKLDNAQVSSLIDSIIQASRISPEIVSNDHLLENGIRVQWYWTKYKRIIKDPDLLKSLIPLNKQAMQELLNIQA